MNTRRAWTGALFLFVIGDAVALQIRGALLPSFQQSFAVSESMLGLVAPAGTVGFIVAVLAVGFATGRIDVKKFLLLGAGGTVLCLFLVAGSVHYVLLLAFLLGQGTAIGVFRGLDRPVLSHLYPSRRGRIFTLHSLAWSLGAVAAPLFVNGVLSIGDWRLTYLLAGLLFVPVVAMIWRLDLPESTANETELSIRALRGLAGNPAILGMSGALLLVGGVEGAIFTWLPYYANQFVSREASNVVLSVYLLAYVPGRFAYSVVAERVRYSSLVLVLAALSVPAAYVAFDGITGRGLLASVFLLGMVVSGLFPMLSAFGIDAAPEYSGPINAIATGATYVGLAVVPVLVGVVAEVRGIGAAMQGLAGLLVALVVVVLATKAAVAGGTAAN